MDKLYKYADTEFTDGDTLLLTYNNEDYEAHKDLFMVWSVGKGRDFIDDFNYPVEGYIIQDGEGLPVGGDYEYPKDVSKIESIDEAIKLSEITPKLIKDLEKGDTAVFKTKNDEIHFRFTFQNELKFDKKYGVISSIDEDGHEEAFYIPVYADELNTNFDKDEGFVQYLGVLPSSL